MIKCLSKPGLEGNLLHLVKNIHDTVHTYQRDVDNSKCRQGRGTAGAPRALLVGMGMVSPL